MHVGAQDRRDLAVVTVLDRRRGHSLVEGLLELVVLACGRADHIGAVAELDDAGGGVDLDLDDAAVGVARRAPAKSASIAAATPGRIGALRSSPCPSRVRKARTSDVSAAALEPMADFVTLSVTRYPSANAVPAIRARLAAKTIGSNVGVRRRMDGDGTRTLGMDLASKADSLRSTTVGPSAEARR